MFVGLCTRNKSQHSYLCVDMGSEENPCFNDKEVHQHVTQTCEIMIITFNNVQEIKEIITW